MASLSTELISGDGRTLTVSEIVQYYRDIVNLSVPTHGKIQKLSEDVFGLTNQFSTVDCDTLESIKTQKVYSLTTKSSGLDSKCIEGVRCVSDAFEVSEQALVTSENGRFMARLKCPNKQDSGSEGPKRQLLEIWDRSRLLKTIDTSESEIHGPINTDSVFGNIVWSSSGDQDKLLYVCQRKKPKYLSFFKEPKPTRNGELGETTNRGEEYIKREDWGECLNGIEHTMVAVLDVANNCQISVIDVDDHSLACPQWLDKGNKIVCEAYAEQPRRLGLLHCNNRPCKLMVYDWRSTSKEPIIELKSTTESFRTPRASHLGNKFVFLASPTFGIHKHSVKLCSYDIRTRKQESLPVSGIELFIENLPENCFTADDNHILFLSNDHLYNHMYLYTLSTKTKTEIKFPNAGISILDFRYNIILASGSDIDATPTLFVATINSYNTNDVVAWHQMEDCIHLEEIEHESYKIPTQDQLSFISAILTKPNLKAIQANLNEKTIQARDKLISSPSKLPTVVLIHGGPNSAFVNNYIPSLIFYTRLGLKTMLINYRGSLGVTEEYSQSLCGKLGQQDLGDCLEAIRYFVQNKLIDSTKLIVSGGSHGGFLACHLSCQDEFKFTSAIIRNPVVDLPSMFATSDIPDWVTAETLAHSYFDPAWVPSADDLLRLRDCSPMYNVAKAYVPTLMQLGNKDRRVKMFQGERWADVLKAKGVDVKCQIYPDVHSLSSKTEVLADLVLTAAVWILSHLPK